MQKMRVYFTVDITIVCCSSRMAGEWRVGNHLSGLVAFSSPFKHSVQMWRERGRLLLFLSCKISYYKLQKPPQNVGLTAYKHKADVWISLLTLLTRCGARTNALFLLMPPLRSQAFVSVLRHRQQNTHN